jgi:hypothetical protein
VGHAKSEKGGLAEAAGDRCREGINHQEISRDIGIPTCGESKSKFEPMWFFLFLAAPQSLESKGIGDDLAVPSTTAPEATKSSRDVQQSAETIPNDRSKRLQTRGNGSRKNWLAVPQISEEFPLRSSALERFFRSGAVDDGLPVAEIAPQSMDDRFRDPAGFAQ